MFAPLAPKSSVAFVSQASISNGAVASYGLRKRVAAVKNTRAVGKRDMKHNDACPNIEVDPETYIVKADGKVCEAAPSMELPLAQSYFAF
jgi:urease